MRLLLGEADARAGVSVAPGLRQVAAGLDQPLRSDEHALGAPTAPVTLVLYGDYESGACGRAHQNVRRARAEYGDRLLFVYRHFPVTQVHPHSQQAAEAAEAAGSQGLFWQMHERLLANQASLDAGCLVEYACDLGLDTHRFLRELAGHVHIERIREDMLGGRRSGVEAAPAFFINGEPFAEGAQAGDALLVAVGRAMP